ncbi:MAG TPA: TIGR03009 domain-containing protein [Pirellulaceae bacterium]|nr:TIGR03009 domain-containing protein [Pirellulaceae bacterium]
MVYRNVSRSVFFSVFACAAISHVAAQVPGQQRTGQQRPVAQTQPRPAANQGVAPQRGATAPPWMPLTPDHEVYLNKILNYWEHKTSSVERYRCNFHRWEYEMARLGKVLKTYTEGKIQYASPDKGLFKAEVIKHRTPPKQPGGEPGWEDQVGGPREHWVCDGESIFEFNHSLKQLIVRPLPPGMKGKQIAEGPLPFMFGAKAAQIKRRFWVRVVTPPNTKKEYHLQAVPRTLQDAQNFRELLIVIAEKDFLPKAMVLLHLNNAKTSYEFQNREVNWNTTLEDINIFKRAFFAPALPARDWKKVVVPTEQAAAGPARQAARGAAVRPPFGPVRQAQTPRGRQAPR